MIGIALTGLAGCGQSLLVDDSIPFLQPQDIAQSKQAIVESELRLNQLGYRFVRVDNEWSWDAEALQNSLIHHPEITNFEREDALSHFAASVSDYLSFSGKYFEVQNERAVIKNLSLQEGPSLYKKNNLVWQTILKFHQNP